MKELKAIIRDHRLDAVLDALHAHPELPGVTVSNVRGFGRAVGRAASGEGLPETYGTTEMIQIECVVNDELLDAIIGLIQTAAHTGGPGDGKIFVYDVGFAVRIRTGERVEAF